MELTSFNYLLLFKPEETILLFSGKIRKFSTSEKMAPPKLSSVIEKVKLHFHTTKL